jgi:undecaprenyl diphosphate synthase
VSYGGREEIVAAARALASAVLEGRITLQEINERTLTQRLWSAGIPDPDLLIRTSGEFRLSNFLLWQLAYTEIYVTATLWPDFNREEFYRALADYQGRERRFGRTAEQPSVTELRSVAR